MKIRVRKKLGKPKGRVARKFPTACNKKKEHIDNLLSQNKNRLNCPYGYEFE